MEPRVIDYNYLHPTGGEIPVRAARLADLLTDMPTLFCLGRMPPLAVVNTILATGLCDAGMSGGCRWEPFQIDEAEYLELVSDLRRESGERGTPTIFEPAPEYVRTKNQWYSWVYHLAFGVPYEEQLHRRDNLDRLAERRDAAYSEGRSAEGEALHWEYYNAGNAMIAFLDQYNDQK